MDRQDGFAAAEIREIDKDLSVETTWAQQGRIQHVGPVRCPNHYHARLAIKAIHLHQEGIKRLLAFVVTTANPRTALAADGVDFIDKDNTGSQLTRLLKGVPHARGTHADKHLDEVGAADAQEGHPGLPRDGTSEQGLPRSRWTDHEHALGDAGTNFGKALRVLQEVDDLLHLFLGLIAACNVLKRGGFLIIRIQARLRLGKLHRPAIGVLEEPKHHEQDDARNEQGRQDIVEEHRPTRLGGDFLKGIPCHRGTQGFEILVRQVAIGKEAGLLVLLGARHFELTGDMEPFLRARCRVRLNREVFELLLLRIGQDLADLEFLGSRPGIRPWDIKEGNDGDHQQQPNDDGFGIHTGAVFIIIRLVVLTHKQRV